MAYEKKTVQEYIAETDDKTVEGFNDNQETRIKAGFDNITTDSVQVGTGGIQSEGDLDMGNKQITNVNNVQVGAGGIDNEGDYFYNGIPLIETGKTGDCDWIKFYDGTLFARQFLWWNAESDANYGLDISVYEPRTSSLSATGNSYQTLRDTLKIGVGIVSNHNVRITRATGTTLDSTPPLALYIDIRGRWKE